jgi:hypothetical protein
MNSLGAELRESIDDHARNLKVDPSLIKFRVGQVVRHRDLGFRAVVIGWRINDDNSENPGKQLLKVLVDQRDLEQHVKETINDAKQFEQMQAAIRSSSSQISGDNLLFNNFIDSADFAILEDAELHRVFHRSTYLYFHRYSSVHQQFLPTPAMCYMYPTDGVDTSAAAALSPARFETVEEEQHAIDASSRLRKVVAALGKQLLGLIDVVAPPAWNTPTSAGSNREEHAKNMGAVLQDLRTHATRCAQFGEGATCPFESIGDGEADIATAAAAARVAVPPKALFLGGAHRLSYQSTTAFATSSEGDVRRGEDSTMGEEVDLACRALGQGECWLLPSLIYS